MYLLYIDDSGSCDLKNDESLILSGGNTRYFVLGAILIKADELCKTEYSPKLDFKNKCLKDQYSEIKFSTSKQQLNCRTQCNKSDGRECFKIKVLELIENCNCKVFACWQDKFFTTSKCIIKNSKDVYKLSFQHLLKLVDTYLFEEKINEPVIVFIDKKDSGDSKDKMIFQAYKEALQNKTIFKAFSNTLFYPSINIVYSKYSLGSQLADFVAGSTWRALESKDDADVHKNSLIITKRLGLKMYRDKEGNLKGGLNCSFWL